MTSQAKVYVAVIAYFSEDGNLFPRRLRWEDGREYSIEKILDVRPAAALKAGGQGDRIRSKSMVIRVIFSLSEVQISVEQTLENGLWNENTSLS